MGGKCLSRSRRKSRAMLVFTFVLYGGLNQLNYVALPVLSGWCVAVSGW